MRETERKKEKRKKEREKRKEERKRRGEERRGKTRREDKKRKKRVTVIINKGELNKQASALLGRTTTVAFY